MSNKITAAIKYMQMPSNPKAVLRELADFANDEGMAYPSIPTIAAALCITERSVSNGIKYLKEVGLITIKTGVGGNNIYFIHPEKFTGEIKKPSNIRVLPLQHIHPCNTFTPATHSTTPEPHSYDPRTTFMSPLNDVHPNHQLTINEPSSNHQEYTHAQKSKPTDQQSQPETPNKKPKQAKKTKPQKTALPEDFEITERVRNWAEQKGHTRLDEHFEAFVLKARSRGYQYIDWDAAFQTAIRDNWAKLNHNQQPARYQTAYDRNLAEAAKWDAFLNTPKSDFIDVTPTDPKQPAIEGARYV